MVVKVALLGVTSWYSITFARALQALGKERASLVGIAHLGVDDDTVMRLNKVTRAGFGERFGSPVFERAETLLDATRPDLVLVTGPNTARPHLTTMALEAGADVFVAKPMTATVEGAAQIRDAARRHPRRLAGALNPARFATAIRDAHRRVQAGEIGEVLTAHPVRRRRGTATPNRTTVRAGWPSAWGPTPPTS
jgi:predicted dehydrogenase